MTQSEAKAILDFLRNEAANLPELTMKEIDAEISATRDDKKSRIRSK